MAHITRRLTPLGSPDPISWIVTMPAGRRSLLFLLSCLALAGCRRNDLVENELRHKEALLREAVADLKRTEAYNIALQREIQGLRSAENCPLPAEIAPSTFGLKRVVLARGTGGYDNDNLPGDEALQVVLEPRDIEDHVVKVPGSLQITAIEIDPHGLKQPLCWWAFAPEQLRPHWKQGLLSTGYSVVLPWTVFPNFETVRVVAQFKLIDGRCFETDKDVKVRLLPVGSRPTPAPAPAPTPAPAPAPEVLPQPSPNPFLIPSSSGYHPAPTSELRWLPAH